MELIKDKTLENIIEKMENDINALKENKEHFNPIDAKERFYLEILGTDDAKALLEIDNALLFLRQHEEIVSMTNPITDKVENAINKIYLRDTKNALENIKKNLENLKPKDDRITNLKNRTIEMIQKLINYIVKNLQVE